MITKGREDFFCLIGVNGLMIGRGECEVPVHLSLEFQYMFIPLHHPLLHMLVRIAEVRVPVRCVQEPPIVTTRMHAYQKQIDVKKQLEEAKYWVKYLKRGRNSRRNNSKRRNICSVPTPEIV